MNYSNGRNLALPTELIKLANLSPVASGGDRWVYHLQEFPDIVLKVTKRLDERRRVNSFRGITIRLFPSTLQRGTTKEYECFVRIQDRALTADHPMPISRLYGFVTTDLGAASMSERIGTDENALGPTLESMIRAQEYPDDIKKLLNQLANKLLQWRVQTTDLMPKNIVFGTNRGQRELVLVDGIGDNFAIPIRTWSYRAMKYGQTSSFQKIAKKTGFVWNSKAHQFE